MLGSIDLGCTASEVVFLYSRSGFKCCNAEVLGSGFELSGSCSAHEPPDPNDYGFRDLGLRM